jgi:hypothetical protein
MKLMSTVLVLSQLFAAASFASPSDIKGSRYFIKSEKTESGNHAFLFCDSKKVPTSCEYIGRNAGYSSEELAEIQHSELIEARWKTGGVVVVGIIGVVVGGGFGFVASGAIGSVTGAISAGQTVVIAGSAVAGGTATLWTDRLNPWHQFAQADVLDEEGLLTKKVVVKSDSEVLEIAQLLNEVLAD